MSEEGTKKKAKNQSGFEHKVFALPLRYSHFTDRILITKEMDTISLRHTNARSSLRNYKSTRSLFDELACHDFHQHPLKGGSSNNCGK